jgi:hypothetical protein
MTTKGSQPAPAHKPASERPRNTEMRMRKKADLPEKICAHCGRPFAWRKKWARMWDEVKYCSQRCREARKDGPGLP